MSFLLCSMGWHYSSLETISYFFSQLCLSGSFTQASLSCSCHTCHGTSLHGIPSAQNTFLPFPLFNSMLGNPSSSLDSFPQDQKNSNGFSYSFFLLSPPAHALLYLLLFMSWRDIRWEYVITICLVEWTFIRAGPCLPTRLLLCLWQLHMQIRAE